MRIVCDTNVLISAILYGGRPRDVLEVIIEGKVCGFISPAIEQEFQDVLGRKKFGLSVSHVYQICQNLRELLHPVFPKETISVIKEDPDDNAILACAIAADADCIVSGDRHLLDLGEFRDVKIVTPAEFLQHMK
ncbi:MAG: putative toxin-antitoxin system toxin component, PIN family [Phycisphaerae bacterium]|nr:putative toxin-antitoxin system toxin component, PIN family [Phycisphaerae bacterium]